VDAVCPRPQIDASRIHIVFIQLGVRMVVRSAAMTASLRVDASAPSTR
jgi:hypothetical protein